ncbi:hypothetical protein [Rhodococcus sp. NBC_00297]|uniref:hypothetical protein n=1 Tax=Rhodococcus sp. NBC_00297 TaxID=2976005 RepID=UPI002E2E16C4|nr:hypothetical protein [Rhodococcus sp. NBC_00297]
MSPRTDAHSDPAVDPLDSLAIAARIEAQYSREIAMYRDLLVRTAGNHRVNDSYHHVPAHDYVVEGSSLLDPGLRIHLGHTHQDGGDLGSFPPGTEVLALRIHVQAFSAEFPTLAAARRQFLDSVSTVEADGWVRALLGDSWADHCYELVVDRDEASRTSHVMTAQRIHVLLLDQHARPLLAPDNFAFRRLWFRISSTRKIPPRDPELAAEINRDGPYSRTKEIRDPRTEKDGGWRIDVTGLSPSQLTPMAGDTARRLIRGVRMRGAIDTRFRPTRVHVDPTLLWVYFRWDGDPETYALTLCPPQTKDDLRGPPWHSPGAIVSEAMESWQEELRTGLRARGIRTRTAEGALHLIGPAADD